MEHEPEEWFRAAAVVNAAATLGGLLVTLFVPKPSVGELAVGVGVGAAAGLAINWFTGCHVCRETAA